MTFPFFFQLFYSSNAIVQQGGETQIVVLSIQHQLAASGENVTLTSSAPAGINVTFLPASPVMVPAVASLNVTLFETASSTATLGNGTVTIKGVAGPNSQTTSFTLRVVQYRVVMIHNTFSPVVLNVTEGSTVYWQNLDGPAAGCGGQPTGGGQHNVVFTTLQGANSPTVNQFGIYSYTFTTPGSYFYYSSIDTDKSMNGTINVLTTAGGLPATPSRLPDFSYFKTGSLVTPAASVERPSSAQSSSSVVGPVLGLMTLPSLFFGWFRFSVLALESIMAVVATSLGVSLRALTASRKRRKSLPAITSSTPWIRSSES